MMFMGFVGGGFVGVTLFLTGEAFGPFSIEIGFKFNLVGKLPNLS